jgi:GDP-4-dehydro-6-deoxy-D-mannose reductase
MVRPFNHAGPRQSARYVLASLALHVAEVEKGCREYVEVGNLDVIRDFIDVRDVVRAYRHLACSGESGEVYNVGSGRGTKIADALKFLCSQGTREIPVRVDSTRVRSVDQPLLIADVSKLRTAVGWEPQYAIEQTLIDMLDFARKIISERSS